MTQRTLDSQREHLARVTDRLADAVLDFLRSRVGDTFHADDLRAHVGRVVGSAAPGSADRILRALRQSKRIDYEVVNRRRSEYRCLEVA